MNMYAALVVDFDSDSDNDDMQVVPVPVPSTVHPTVQTHHVSRQSLPVRPYGATSVTPDTTPVMPARRGRMSRGDPVDIKALMSRRTTPTPAWSRTGRVTATPVVPDKETFPVIGTPVVPLSQWTSLGKIKEAAELPDPAPVQRQRRKNVMAARDAWLRSHQAKTGQSDEDYLETMLKTLPTDAFLIQDKVPVAEIGPVKQEKVWEKIVPEMDDEIKIEIEDEEWAAWDVDDSGVKVL
jgi:hypothetical protein